jgi:hypothetical protein
MKILQKSSLFPESHAGLSGACAVCTVTVELDETDEPKRVSFLKESGQIGAFEVDCPNCQSRKLFIEAQPALGESDEDRQAKAREFATFAANEAHAGRVQR